MKKKLSGRGVARAMLIASMLALPSVGWAGENPIPVDGSPSAGPDDALVTIVEFSDFQCPFCARAAGTIDEVREKYPKEVRVVFKHFPLAFHKQADEAARASMAAHRQGKFWVYHDKLFSRATKLRELDNSGELDGHFSELAGFVGMDPAQFSTDYKDPAIDELVKRDMALGTKLGVRGTPHFFINGTRVSGAQPLSRFEEIIDAELASARAAIAAKEATRANVYEVMAAKNFKEPEPPKKPKPAVSDVQMVPVEADDATYGSAKKALVTIVEFSDFQCPFCARGAKTIDEIKEAYGDDVRIVFKHLPLPFHKQAEDAAVAALAAGRQGKFWVYHDLLFENRQRLKEPEIWIALANEAKLNVKKFEKDYNDPKLRKQVKRDLELAGEVGARGTPNFFINGRKVTGAQPFPKFKTIIDEQIVLAKKIKKEKKLSGEKLYAALVEENKKNIPEPAEDVKPAKPAKVLSADQYKKLRAYKGAPTMGNAKKARVVIYEFTDLQCPYCRRADETIAQIKKEYGSKVAVVTFQFPLAFHQQADEAARAVLAAKRQGKSWEMRAVIFEEQRSLRDGDIDSTLIGFAKELGLNVKKFKKDYNDPKLQEQVDAEIKLGGELGVRGTPNFFINDKRLVGAQPADAFKKLIDAELSAKKK